MWINQDLKESTKTHPDGVVLSGAGARERHNLVLLNDGNSNVRAQSVDHPVQCGKRQSQSVRHCSQIGWRTFVESLRRNLLGGSLDNVDGLEGGANFENSVNNTIVAISLEQNALEISNSTAHFWMKERERWWLEGCKCEQLDGRKKLDEEGVQLGSSCLNWTMYSPSTRKPLGAFKRGAKSIKIKSMNVSTL